MHFYTLHMYAQDTIKVVNNESLKNEIQQHFDRLNSQPKTIQEKTELEISKLLLFNSDQHIIKDSIALYTFSIIIQGYRKTNAYIITKIKSNDSLCFKFFPKIDSLIRKVNFNVFVCRQGFNQIVIPVAIVLTAHENMQKNEKLNIANIPKQLDSFFDKNNKLRYQSIYLSPITIMLDNQVYN